MTSTELKAIEYTTTLLLYLEPLPPPLCWDAPATVQPLKTMRLGVGCCLTPARAAGDAQQVQNAEIWADLSEVVGEPETLKHFFKDYCKTDVVDHPIADMFHDSMSVPHKLRKGPLLVCRDTSGHIEAAVEYAAPGPTYGIQRAKTETRTTLFLSRLVFQESRAPTVFASYRYNREGT